MGSHKRRPIRRNCLYQSNSSNGIHFPREGMVRRRTQRCRSARRPISHCDRQSIPEFPAYRLSLFANMLINNLPTIPEEDHYSSECFADNEASDSAGEQTTTGSTPKPRNKLLSANAVKIQSPPVPSAGDDCQEDKTPSNKSVTSALAASNTESDTLKCEDSSSSPAHNPTRFSLAKSFKELSSRVVRPAHNLVRGFVQRRRTGLGSNSNRALTGVMSMSFEQLDQYTTRSLVYFKLKPSV